MVWRVSGCLLASLGLSLNMRTLIFSMPFPDHKGCLAQTGPRTNLQERMNTRLNLEVRQPHWEARGPKIDENKTATPHG